MMCRDGTCALDNSVMAVALTLWLLYTFDKHASCEIFFHHSSKFVYPQRSVFVPDVLVLLCISFWILEQCFTFRIEFLKVHLEACEAVKKLVI